jgi:sulfur transfer protein SufE
MAVKLPEKLAELAGLQPQEIASIPPEVIYRFFTRELSLAKSIGLMEMVKKMKAPANQTLQQEANFSGERP